MAVKDKNRAGRYVKQPGNYRAFIPKPLPPDPPVERDKELEILLSAADRAIGRLDAATELLPNPDLFVAMYVRKEAVLSSQIEGTQASLVDVLEYESETAGNGGTADIREVVNYVDAMNYGLERLEKMPLSIRLIKEIHERLLRGVRGSQREPGEFRRSQNWIGPQGTNLSEAMFIPPPPHEVLEHMGKLELFLQRDQQMAPLIKFGLAHAQFETIHPFLDGNGRMGRLLITFLLCWHGILKRPLLYLSIYLKRNREQYYSLLQNIRDRGDWESWLKFFLRGVKEVSLEATDTARKIQVMRENYREIIGMEFPNTANGYIILDHIFEKPSIKVGQIAEKLNKSYPVASTLVKKMQELGILEETTGRKRNRKYRFQPYIDLLA